MLILKVMHPCVLKFVHNRFSVMYVYSCDIIELQKAILFHCRQLLKDNRIDYRPERPERGGRRSPEPR